MKQEATVLELRRLYVCDREARHVFTSRINNAVHLGEINVRIDVLKIGVCLKI